MKRRREIAIILDALIVSEVLKDDKTDEARCAIKESLKEIRREKYRERHQVRGGCSSS